MREEKETTKNKKKEKHRKCCASQINTACCGGLRGAFEGALEGGNWAIGRGCGLHSALGPECEPQPCLCRFGQTAGCTQTRIRRASSDHSLVGRACCCRQRAAPIQKNHNKDSLCVQTLCKLSDTRRTSACEHVINT